MNTAQMESVCIMGESMEIIAVVVLNIRSNLTRLIFLILPEKVKTKYIKLLNHTYKMEF